MIGGEGVERELVGVGTKPANGGRAGKTNAREAPSAMAVAELIEKKNGSLELKGRRAGTMEVLDAKLADKVGRLKSRCIEFLVLTTRNYNHR